MRIRAFVSGGDKPEGTLSACTTTNECCVKGDSADYKNGDDCTINTPNDGMCYYGTCVAKGCTYDENKCTGKAEYCASPNDNCEVAFPIGKTGTCVKADFTKLDVAGKTYYVSNLYMPWWDADAACKALGKSLLSVDDLVSGWNGSSYGMYTKTALLEALASELGDLYYMWTKDLRNDDCEAFYVATGGFVGYGNRANSGGNLALCR